MNIKRLISFCIIFFIYFISRCQILDSAIIMDLYSAKLNSHFNNCNMHNNNTFSGTDTVKLFLPNDTVTVFDEYENGKKKKSTGYWNNGNKYRETYYNGIEKHGWDINWYKNGNKEFEIFFDNGIEFSPFISYYENGRIKGIITSLSSNNRKGCTYWHINGTLMTEVTYLNDTSDSFIEKNYFENGQLSTESIYNAGKQKYNAYYENGKKAWEGYIFNALWGRLGKWEEWYITGVKKREYYFNDTIPNIRAGTWKWWNEKGYLIKEETYKNDILINSKEFINRLQKSE